VVAKRAFELTEREKQTFATSSSKYLNEINVLFYITFSCFLLKIHAIFLFSAKNSNQESMTRYSSYFALLQMRDEV
ncbi:hypothetical protein, partial [Klebsiella pneumoniae]|uniref:hypothetical protein n=1 Tax=Klebsiella pneumoniae TaxID=573 RepID=UPI001C70D7B5